MTDIIVLFCTSALGFLIGNAWENRLLNKEKLYVDLLDFAIKFRSNIQCGKVVLEDFLTAFNQGCSQEFRQYSEQYLLGKSCKCKLIKGKELQYVMRFFCGLNATNSLVLVEHLNLNVVYFQECLNKVRADNNSKGKVGQKLGLLCGVILGLVLI